MPRLCWVTSNLSAFPVDSVNCVLGLQKGLWLCLQVCCQSRGAQVGLILFH